MLAASDFADALLILLLQHNNPCPHHRAVRKNPTTTTRVTSLDAAAAVSSTLPFCNKNNGGGVGLLQGLDYAKEEATFFNPKLCMSVESFEWLDLKQIVWETAEKDIKQGHVSDTSTLEYVDRLWLAMGTFFNTGRIVGRAPLIEALRTMVVGVGQFSLLLGGVSVGKSIVLQNVTNHYNNGSVKDEKASKHMVLYVDGRSYHGDLSKGLAFSLASLQASQYVPNYHCADETWLRLLRNIRVASKTAVTQQVKEAVDGMELLQDDETTKEAIAAIMDRAAQLFYLSISDDEGATPPPPPRPESLVTKFIDFAESQNKRPAIILDEANAFLLLNKEDGKINAGLMQDFMSVLVKYTKQDNKLNLIMATSEYSFPQALENVVSLRHISSVVVAAELTPKDTWSLLVNARYPNSSETNVTGKVPPEGEKIIGMGPNLAELFLSAYGGHLLSMKNALYRLKLMKNTFRLRGAFPTMASRIAACLEETPGTRKLLSEMAEFGFASVEVSSLEAANKIAELDIGGVVTQDAIVLGVPNTSIWENADTETDIYDYGVLPSSQTMRLVIGRHLAKLARLEGEEEQLAAKKKSKSLWRGLSFWRRR